MHNTHMLRGLQLPQYIIPFNKFSQTLMTVHVNITAFASSIYQSQKNLLQCLGVLQLWSGNERHALQNRCAKSMHRPRKGGRDDTLSMLVESSGKAASINFLSYSVVIPKGEIFATPAG